MQLLVLSIGPVQDFIASARRCRDLWFGSWMLSDLSRAAAAALADAEGVGAEALVFPGATARASLEPGDDEQPVANKVLVRVEGGRTAARAAAKCAEDAVKARLEQLAEAAFDAAGADDPDRERHFERERAWSQVRDLLEVHWAACPIDAAPEGYEEARRDAERILAAVKNTKLWTAPPWNADGWAEGRYKSSLDGARESVLAEEILGKAPKAGHGIPRRRRTWYGVHPTERLCGVGLLKRLGRRPAEAGDSAARVDSTSHVAALPDLLGIVRACEEDETYRARVEEAWQDYRELLESEGVSGCLDVVGAAPLEVFGRDDGALLYPGRLEEELDEAGIDDKRTRDRASALLRSFRRVAGLRETESAPYLGILLGDGDRMGNLIDELGEFAQHRALSLQLAEHARAARILVTEHQGSPIYSGGDDVLALVPVHRAVACARALAEALSDRLAAFSGAGVPTGFSVGLVIAHHLRPLDETLSEVRRAEGDAKQAGGRNALSISLLKRGGAPVSVRGKWGAIDRRLELFARWTREDAVPATLSHELRSVGRVSSELRRLGHAETAKGIECAELRRLLSRKRARRGEQALDSKHHDDLMGHVKDGLHPDDLGRELFVARLLADAQRRAGEPPAGAAA